MKSIGCSKIVFKTFCFDCINSILQNILLNGHIIHIEHMSIDCLQIPCQKRPNFAYGWWGNSCPVKYGFSKTLFIIFVLVYTRKTTFGCYIHHIFTLGNYSKTINQTRVSHVVYTHTLLPDMLSSSFCEYT